MNTVKLAIDLGTTNSAIAQYENGKVIIFKNPVGQKDTLPSVVGFRPDRILVGDKAKEFLSKDSANVMSGFKRKMGTDEKMYIPNIDENVTPIELSTIVLQELKSFVFTGDPAEAVVVTVPASFDIIQSNATIEAAQNAGFDSVYLLQEPIAASLAFFNQSKNITDSLWLVYDLGGGTFDVALVEIKDGNITILDNEGNNFLGGMDFDLSIIESIMVPHIIEKTGYQEFAEEYNVKYGKYEKLFHIMLYKAEEAKIELSSREETEIEFSAEIEGKEYDFYIPITQSEIAELIRPRTMDTVKMLRDLLQRNGKNTTDIQQLVMVGGSTLIPAIRDIVLENIGIPINTNIDPTTAIAIGAAYYASTKTYTSSNDLDDELIENIEEMASEVSENVLDFKISYNKMSTEDEEVFLFRAKGELPEDLYYRIVRGDGGFDTGYLKLKDKLTEFLPLLKETQNIFYFKVYDANYHELKQYHTQVDISHGLFSIQGQPLPKDICIEVDDEDTKATKLQLIFEKNNLLPLKKTIYKTINQTVKQGSDDKIIVNILEGDKLARPSSNLVTGCIEISGKNLTTDLLKGSDIEIQIMLDESRKLSLKAYLVMTEQEFENVFTITEKHISLDRLKEQFLTLENDLKFGMRHMYDDDTAWMSETDELINELADHKKTLAKLRDKDKSDKKYIIADALMRISQKYDRLGGEERLEELREKFYLLIDEAEQTMDMVDYQKASIEDKFNSFKRHQVDGFGSKQASVLERLNKQLMDLIWDMKVNTNSYLIALYNGFKMYPPESYRDYKGAQVIMKYADKALEKENFSEFRNHVNNLASLMKHNQSDYSEKLKGTGIA